MTFKSLLVLIRATVLLFGTGFGILMIGPFQGLEQAFGLTDLQAHAIAFFVMSLLVYLVAPNRRRSDLSLVVFGIGVLIELTQAATGRSFSLADVAANGLGVAAAFAPALIEQLRHTVRLTPDAQVATISGMDRRRGHATRSDYQITPARSLVSE